MNFEPDHNKGHTLTDMPSFDPICSESISADRVYRIAASGEHVIASYGHFVIAEARSMVLAKPGSHVVALLGAKIAHFSGANVIGHDGAVILQVDRGSEESIEMRETQIDAAPNHSDYAITTLSNYDLAANELRSLKCYLSPTQSTRAPVPSSRWLDTFPRLRRHKSMAKPNGAYLEGTKRKIQKRLWQILVSIKSNYAAEASTLYGVS
jgi:hypothetical protein